MIAPPFPAVFLALSTMLLSSPSGEIQAAPRGLPRFIAPLHVHPRDDEAWYVLEGNLRVL